MYAHEKAKMQKIKIHKIASEQYHYYNGAISMVHVAQDAGFKSRAAKAFLLGYTNSQGMHSSVQ